MRSRIRIYIEMKSRIGIRIEKKDSNPLHSVSDPQNWMHLALIQSHPKLKNTGTGIVLMCFFISRIGVRVSISRIGVEDQYSVVLFLLLKKARFQTALKNFNIFLLLPIVLLIWQTVRLLAVSGERAALSS